MQRIALIHEWLTTYAGSEKVLEQLLLLHPSADLFAVADMLPKHQRGFLHGTRPFTSFIQHLPFARRALRHYLPLMPLAVEQWDLTSYDIVLSSNHAVAKGVLTGPGQLHISYVHSPIRYAWDLQHQYLREAGLSRGVRSALVRLLLHYLRMWDSVSSTRVDVFVANSNFIAGRIRKSYNRDAQVIYPPVDVEAFPLHRCKEDYYVAASRLVPYKRMDVVVEAFRKMPDRQLVLIGDGPMFKRLAARAPSNVRMVGYQPHDRLKHYLQRAKAFVFAAEEDFGILPVEAQACGTPVLAFGRGGALETVIDGVTGLFFDEQHPGCIVDAVQTFETECDQYDPVLIRQHAERFRPERFRDEFAALVHREWRAFDKHRSFNRQSKSPLSCPRSTVGESFANVGT